jgi:hypothetical protein
MRLSRYALFAVAGTALFLSSCGDSEENAFPVRTYTMGERVTLGHLVYVVFETQWATHLGEGADARVPQNRFFMIRLSAVNGAGKEASVPTLTLEDDKGVSFQELADGTGVPQFIGYLRTVRPAESAQGHALFDAPPRHYKLKIMDEDSDHYAWVDIPLSFNSESPEVPLVDDKKKVEPLIKK